MKRILKSAVVMQLGVLLAMMAALPALAAAPQAPDALALSGDAQPEAVNLVWTDNADNETAYYVERKGPGEAVFTAIASLPANRSDYADSSLTPGETYIYRVWCWNIQGASGYSNELSVKTPETGSSTPPLAAPIGLAVSGDPSFDAVSLVWKDKASNETGYYVDRQGPGETVFTTIATLEADAEGFTDNTVSPASLYRYRVWCWNASRSSGYSNTLNVETPPAAPPTAPGALRLVAATSTRIDLAWSDNSSTETAWIIERKAAGDDFSVYYTGAANLTSFSDQAVIPGAVYIYRVACSNSAGSSDYSGELSVTVPAAGTPPVFVSTVVSYYLNNSTFYVNGSARTMDVSPLASQERIFLPMRFVAEPLGGTAVWDGPNGKAVVNLNDHVIELEIGNNTAVVDGASTMIDEENPDVVPLIVEPGRIMLPLRFIAESTGCDVNWIQDTNEARVTFTPSA